MSALTYTTHPSRMREYRAPTPQTNRQIGVKYNAANDRPSVISYVTRLLLCVSDDGFFPRFPALVRTVINVGAATTSYVSRGRARLIVGGGERGTRGPTGDATTTTNSHYTAPEYFER